MEVSIRHFDGVHGTSNDLTQVARQLAARLSQAPGFVSFFVVDSGTGVLAVVSIFEDKAGLEESDRLVSASLSDHLGSPLPERTQSMLGEMIFQKGL